MKYLINFSYDGSSFKGYQRQKNLKTVQGVLEEHLSKLNNQQVLLTSSGRTDINVHAKFQCAHFDLNKEISCYNIKKYLNKKLNGEIYINNVFLVEDSYHARYDVLSKEYRYFVNTGNFNVFKRNYEYQLNKPLDINKINEILPLFIGKHNFKSFCNNAKERTNFERTIYEIKINQKDDIVELIFIGDGFLKQMVRNIVGVLIEVGLGKISLEQVENIISNKDRCYNIKSVPGCGLYLWNVTYKNL